MALEKYPIPCSDLISLEGCKKIVVLGGTDQKLKDASPPLDLLLFESSDVQK